MSFHPICKRFGTSIQPLGYPSFLFLLCLFSLVGHSEGADLFSAQSITVEGNILSVIPADLDGTGPAEIVVLSKTGIYPDEKRWISVYSMGTSEQYADSAGQRWEVDPAATMLEVGDIAPSPGKEILFLTDLGIDYYSHGGNGKFSTSSRTLLSYPTITVSPQAGSLPRTQLLADWKNNGSKMLLLPQFKALVFFSQNGNGEWQKSDTVTVAPRAFLFSGSEEDGAYRDYSIRTEFRLPRIFTGDFNGDRLTDLLLSEQESLTVHLQQSGGHYSSAPSFTHVFPVRPSDNNEDANQRFYTTPVDVNGDRFADVILTATRGTGKFLEREIHIFVYLNRQNPERPFAQKPDQQITVTGITPGVNLVDVNQDGKKDLLFSKVPLGFWRIVRNLISKRVKLDTCIYLLNGEHRYSVKPDFRLNTDYQIDLKNRIRFRGTWPALKNDFNGDGRIDLLVARDDKIEIFLNSSNENLFSKPFTQSGVVTSSWMDISDLNSDGLNDLLFYQKKMDGEISILLNTGNWKKTFAAGKKSKAMSEK